MTILTPSSAYESAVIYMEVQLLSTIHERQLNQLGNGLQVTKCLKFDDPSQTAIQHFHF